MIASRPGLGVVGLLWLLGCTTSSTETDDDGATSTTAGSPASASGASASSAGSGGGGTSSSATGAGGATAGSGGGEGGAPAEWPSCDTEPQGVPQKTIHALWQDDPSEPTEVWVPGVYVTAVAGGGCVDGKGCQIFVQQQESFADVDAGSQQAIKLFASIQTAKHFVGIEVGDQVDILAHAWRYDVGGQRELLLQVANNLPGCATVVGSGDPQPVGGLALEDLDVALYEDTMGPLLIRLETVSGKPKGATELFGLWESFMSGEGPIEEVTSLSPYMLPGSVFTGLTPELIHNFPEVVGVFSLFVPPGAPVSKYEVVYPRSMDDMPFGGQ